MVPGQGRGGCPQHPSFRHPLPTNRSLGTYYVPGPLQSRRGCTFVTGVHQAWVGPGRLHMQRKAWSLDPTLHPLHLFLTRPRVQCWVQLGSTFDLGLAFSPQVAQTQGPQGPVRPGPPILTLSPSISWPLGLCCVGPGPQARQKVHTAVHDLVSAIPVGTELLPRRTCGSRRRAQHKRAHIQNPLYHNSCPHSSQAGACPPVLGTPACTRTHRRPTQPPHACLPT